MRRTIRRWLRDGPDAERWGRYLSAAGLIILTWALIVAAAGHALSEMGGL